MTTPSTGPVEIDGKFFACRGRRFPVRGVTYGTFAPRSDGEPFPTHNRIKADFVAMSDAGFNVVRTYTEPPEDLISVARDWGLRVFAGVHWNDWRYMVGGSRRQQRAVERAAEGEVRAATRRLAGNEGVMAVCVGNEIPADVIRWIGTRHVSRFVGTLCDVVREEDSDRLVTFANYPSAEYLPLDGLDFLTFNVFLEKRSEFRRYLTRLNLLAGERPLVLGEFGAHAGVGDPGEDAQSESVNWQLEVALERGVAGTCLFSWTDEWWVGGQPVDGWRFGLTRADRSPRPLLDVAARWNSRVVEDLREPTDWPSVSVVVCAYNAADTLEECLRHACALNYPRLEVIVVDDGSTDNTAVIARSYPRARLVQIPHSGLSVARNHGFQVAGSELVAYLDADAYPSPEWPYYLAIGLDGPQVGGVGGPNVPPRTDSAAAQRTGRAPGRPTHVLLSDDRAEHVPGCNMAFRKSVLEEVGGFDPEFVSAGDDVDLCWRVLERGVEIGFHPAAVVSHHPRATTRGYLRQQFGYGRSEVGVEARHPDRFGAMGSARWRGHVYAAGGSGGPLWTRQSVYRGPFGSAAFQSVYRDGGHILALAHQVGVPLALGLACSAPAAALVWPLGIPGLCAVAFLASLIALDAALCAPPPAVRRRRIAFKLHVGLLTVLQPLARHAGRRTRRAERSPGSPAPTLVPPMGRAGRQGLIWREDRPRTELISAVIDHLRATRCRVTAATAWDRHDAYVGGSVLVRGVITSSSHPPGWVQAKVEERLRRRLAWILLPLVVGLGLLQPMAAVLFFGALGLDVFAGSWRVRRARRHLLGLVSSHFVKQETEDPVRVEVGLGKLACGPGMRAVVASNLAKSTRRLLGFAKGKEPVACRVERAPTGLLGNNWLAAREEACGPVTEPAAVGADVHGFGHAELSCCTLDELPVSPRVPRDRPRLAERPASVEEPLPVLGVGRIDLQCHLERFSGAPRQIGEGAELVSTQPESGSAVGDGLERTPPGGHRSEVSLRDPGDRPVLEHHRGRRGQPHAPASWNDAAGLSDVGAHGHEAIVAGEHVGQAEFRPHLGEPRVDVDEDPQTDEVEDGRIGEETHHIKEKRTIGPPLELGAGQPDGAFAGKQDAEVVRQSKALHRRTEPLKDGHRSVGVTGRRFEAVNEDRLETEAAQTEHPVHERPDVSASSGDLGDAPCDDGPGHWGVPPSSALPAVQYLTSPPL